MRWRNIAFMTVVLVFILSGPAASQEWVDIKDPKDLRALHSNKTFRGTLWGSTCRRTLPCRRQRHSDLRTTSVSLLLGRLRATTKCVSPTRVGQGVGSSSVARRTQTSM